LPVALLVASGLLLLTQALPVPSYFVAGGLLASFMYLTFRLRANRAYVPTLLATLSHRLFMPDRHGGDFLNTGKEELVREFERGIASPDENMVYAYARMLIAVRPKEAPGIIADRLPSLSYSARDRLLRLLIMHRLPVTEILHASLAETDPHLRATILEALFESRDARARTQVESCLDSDNPRLAAAGVYGAHCYAMREHESRARQIWERLLTSRREEENIAGLGLLGRIQDPERLSRLGELLVDRTDRVRRKALESLARFPAGTLAEFEDILRAQFQSDDPVIRMKCVMASRVLDPEAGRSFCVQAMEDEHHAVREAALNQLEEREGSARAVDIVTREVLENHGTPRTQQSALTFLERHRISSDIFERIAGMKTGEASTLFRAREVLQHDLEMTGHDDATDLLSLVLHERVTQTLDLALMAMENFEDRATIAAIRAGLASGDSRQIARACEALQSLHHQALGTPLIAILDPTGAVSRERRAMTGEVFRSAKDVIAWCTRHPDAWLSECAGRAVSSSNPAGA